MGGNSARYVERVVESGRWLIGSQRVANLGPQYKFPVPPGILDYEGKKWVSISDYRPTDVTSDISCSTVAVALWVLQSTPVTPTLKLVLDEVVEGGVGRVAVNNPRWYPRLQS